MRALASRSRPTPLGWTFLVMGLVSAALPARGAAQDPAEPTPEPPATYDVPPGYAPPPSETPAQPPPQAQPYPQPQAQPYPQPQAQPYPQPQAQPYGVQQPYQPYGAQPYGGQPYRGRRRLERIGANEVVPPGVETLERRRYVLSFIGLGMFAVSYGLTLSVALNNGYDGGVVFIPVLGPVLATARGEYPFDDIPGLSVLDSLVQVTGIVLFGFGMKKRRYAVYYVDTDRGRRLAFTPGVGLGSASLHVRF